MLSRFLWKFLYCLSECTILKWICHRCARVFAYRGVSRQGVIEVLCAGFWDFSEPLEGFRGRNRKIYFWRTVLSARVISRKDSRGIWSVGVAKTSRRVRFSAFRGSHYLYRRRPCSPFTWKVQRRRSSYVVHISVRMCRLCVHSGSVMNSCFQSNESMPSCRNLGQNPD